MGQARGPWERKRQLAPSGPEDVAVAGQIQCLAQEHHLSQIGAGAAQWPGVKHPCSLCHTTTAPHFPQD